MNYLFLSKTNLFRSIHETEIKTILSCLAATEKRYKKDETIFRAGDVITNIGLVEEGSVNIVVNFYWGDSNIFSHVEKGKIFGETYAAIPGKELLCDVVAAEDCVILFMNMNGLLTTCQNSCSYHQRLINNLLRILANNNLNLSNRMIHIASKSIRERLLSYLTWMSIESRSMSFSIPFSRQQLAEYLGVDRSALSNELSKMQKDGLISYRKNEFTLYSESESLV